MLHFCDAAAGACIMASGDPDEQKKLGSSVERFSDSRWSCMKEKVVVQGNCYKFSQNARLEEALLATGERELCEASRRDRVWGIGYRADEAEMYREVFFLEGGFYWGSV